MMDIAISVRTALVNTRPHLPDITPDTSFAADLRCDAIDMVCIEMAVSDDCDVGFPALAFESCSTVGELIALARNRSQSFPGMASAIFARWVSLLPGHVEPSQLHLFDREAA